MTPVVVPQEAIDSCIGKRLAKVLNDVLPGCSFKETTRTFVFEDGTGLTFNSAGMFWLETQRTIEHALQVLKNVRT